MIRSILNGETVDFHGDVIALNHARLSFPALRAQIPVYVASNGVMGQRMAAEVADGLIANACASIAEVHALRAAVNEAARRAGRDPRAVKIVARLNTCVADDRAARDAVRPSVARYLGGPVHLRTLASQGLALPAEALARVAGVPYSAGTTPYLPLLPLVTDQHVDALTLAGTVDEVVAHAISLRDAGVDAIIARPTAPNANMNDDHL